MTKEELKKSIQKVKKFAESVEGGKKILAALNAAQEAADLLEKQRTVTPDILKKAFNK